MIVPTDPIVSGETTPIQLAVPVGSPFPAVPPKPIKPAMLTPMALRALLPVPVDYNRAIPSTRKRWKVSGFLSKSGRAVSRTADVLRRHRQSLGLVMTAILLGISLTTIVILADAPKTAPSVEATQAPAVVAAAPAPAPVQDVPASPEESDALAGIRIVDPSWDKKMSCNEGTWPYIDQRCLVKDEKQSAAKAENKIGPRMIGSTPRPQALEPIGPIGSTTAIVPAAPKVNVTDGAAPRAEDVEQDAEQHEADIREREDIRKKYEAIRKKNEDIRPARVPDAAPMRAADVESSKPVEIRTSTTPAETVSQRSYSSPKHVRSKPRRQRTRTVRPTEEAQPAERRQRAVSVRRKRQAAPAVADARRRPRQRVVQQAQAPQAPQFFFPFGWFVQAR